MKISVAGSKRKVGAGWIIDLAATFNYETERLPGKIPLEELDAFLRPRLDNPDAGEEMLSFKETLGFLSAVLTGGQHNTFIACAGLARLGYYKDPVEFKKKISEAVTNTDRLWNATLFSIETIMGFPRGSLADLSRQ